MIYYLFFKNQRGGKKGSHASKERMKKRWTQPADPAPDPGDLGHGCEVARPRLVAHCTYSEKKKEGIVTREEVVQLL